MARTARPAAPATERERPHAAYLFVGEKPSVTAHRRSSTWETANLAGRTLGDALDSIGVPTAARAFLNLFGDHPDAPEDAGPELARRLRRIRRLGRTATIVGMGQKVCRALGEHGVAHVAIIHPAARGRIRRKDLYIAHVAEALGHAAGAAVRNP